MDPSGGRGNQQVLEALEAQLKAAKQARDAPLSRSLCLCSSLFEQVLLEQDGVGDDEPQETHELVRRWRAKVQRLLCRCNAC